MEKLIRSILQPRECHNYTLLIESQKIFELAQRLNHVPNSIAIIVENETKRREGHKVEYLQYAAKVCALRKQQLPFFMPLPILTNEFSKGSLQDLFEFFSSNKEYFEKKLADENKRGNIKIFAQSGLIFLGLTFCWYGVTYKFPPQHVGAVAIFLYSMQYLFSRVERNSRYKKGLKDFIAQSEAALSTISGALD